MGVTFGGQPCLEPVALYDSCLEQEPPVPTAPWFGQANYFRCPLGRQPGRGMLLMARRELDLLNRGSAGRNQPFDLVIKDDSNRSVTLKNLIIIRALAVSPSKADTADTPYYLEIADQRVLWSMAKIDKAYNVRDSEGSSSAFLSATKNSGSDWTWATMFADIWSQHGLLGTAPSLPFTPDGTPEGWIFWASNAWDALNDVLDRIGCAFKLDPTTGTKSIVRRGYDTSNTGANAVNRMVPYRLWDTYEIEPEYGRLPEKITVRFAKSPPFTDGTSNFYTVDVADTSTTRALTGTRVILDDDLLALYDSTPTLTNSAALNTRAAERAAAWFKAARLAGQTEILEYGGIHTTDVLTALGTLYGEVGWFDRGKGYRTALAAKAVIPAEWEDARQIALPFTVAEVDGSPSVANPTTLQLPNDAMSNPSANVARLLEASGSTGGTISLSAQTLGDGQKTVNRTFHATESTGSALPTMTLGGTVKVYPDGTDFWIDDLSASSFEDLRVRARIRCVELIGVGNPATGDQTLLGGHYLQFYANSTDTSGGESIRVSIDTNGVDTVTFSIANNGVYTGLRYGFAGGPYGATSAGGSFVGGLYVSTTGLTVSEGGTGSTTLTDGAVLIGNGTSALNSVTLTNGQILVGATGSDPTAQTVSGDATLSAAGVVSVLSASTSFALSGDISPAQLTADVDNWNPTGW